MRQKTEETSYRISNYIYWLISRMYKELKKSNRRTANHSNNKWADRQFSKQTKKDFQISKNVWQSSHPHL